MKVRLKHEISGSRDGQPWPAAGSEVDLPDSEALSLLQTGAAVAVDSRNDDVEYRSIDDVEGIDEATKEQVKRATVTRERAARSKRAHESVNLGAADPEQPVEDDNGPRLPEVNAEESARVEDPAVPTQSLDGPTGETAEVSVGKGDELPGTSKSAPAAKKAAAAPAKASDKK